MRLVLASSSPRRRELLSGLGLELVVRSVAVDETPREGEGAQAMVLRLAREKAEASAAAANGGGAELVIAADTAVLIDGELLGKPVDPAEATAMLTRLAGNWHQVLTGVAVRTSHDGRLVAEVERSRVRMAALTPARVRWYVGTGEPMDKAGAYAIQGVGALLVEEVVGNYTNVVGLPLPLTARLVAALGRDLLGFRRDGGRA